MGLHSPVQLPDPRLEWRSLPTESIASRLQPLLHDAYIETDDGSLSLKPSATALHWMLETPGADPNLRVGLGVRGDDELIGFVCAVPSAFMLRGKEQSSAVEVSFLCVRRDWRGQGLTRILLDELRRRCAVADVRCAIFTAAKPRLPPLLCLECYHCPLDTHSLVRAGFIRGGDPGLAQASSTPSYSRQLARLFLASKLKRLFKRGRDTASGDEQHSRRGAARQSSLSASSTACFGPMRGSDEAVCHQLLQRQACAVAGLAPSLDLAQFRCARCQARRARAPWCEGCVAVSHASRAGTVSSAAVSTPLFFDGGAIEG